MPRYFNIKDLLKDHEIDDNILLNNIQESGCYDSTDIFQILLENNIHQIELLQDVSKILNEEQAQHYFKSVIELLVSQNSFDEATLVQIIKFKEFPKVYVACLQLNDCKLLNKETLKQILTPEIEKQVQLLTKSFPIKKSYLYFKRHYTFPIKWGLGLGLGISLGLYWLASLKILCFSALIAHPVIGIALICSSTALLFFFGKIGHEIASQTRQLHCLST